MTRVGSQLVAAASWALVAGLFVAPLTLGKLSEGRDLWAHIVLCVIAGAAAVGALLAGVPRLRFRRADVALALLLGAYVAASFVTVYPRATLSELMRLLDYLALYLLVRLLLRDREMLLAGAVSFACGAAACAVLGLQGYLATALAGDASWRAFGPFFNPNLLAAALLMAVPMWIALLRISPLPMLRLACGVGLALCWVCFFVTGSKGGALALMGALVVGSVLAPDPAKGGLLKRALIGVGIVVLAGAAALLLPPIRVRLAEAFGPQSNSMMFRFYTWLGTWHMVLARPILGFGPGTFAFAYPRFAIVGHTRLAHETYLQVAAETGLIGGAALLGALGTQLAAGFRGARRLAGDARTIAAAAAAGMVGFCIHNVVDYAWHVTATGMAFWALAGFVGAALGTPEESAPGAADTSPRKKGKRARRRAEELRPVPWAWVAVSVIAAVAATVPAAMALQASRLASIGDLPSASRLDPLNEAYHRQLAMMAQGAARDGRPWLHDKAISEWERVKRLRPTYESAYYHLGSIYEEQGEPDKALAEYQKAASHRPTWTRALVAQAKLLDELGRDEEALRVYGRLDALSESPLFRYPAIADDLDPNFAYAWLAIADSETTSEARPRYVRAARYLRRVMAANRRMEAVWRFSGDWERKQGPELVQLAEETARRHLSFEDPGPRLRASLLVVDAGLPGLAEELFVDPDDDIAGEAFFGKILKGWSDYVAACHSRARGQFEASERLIRTAAEKLAGPLEMQEAVDQLRGEPYGWSDAEIDALRQPMRDAEKLGPANAGR